MQNVMTVPSALARRTGWVLSGLTILFMLFDGGSKLALEHHTIEATTQIGYPVSALRPMGLTLLIITVLYAIPRTAVLGAVLLTGFLGGAVASKVRIVDPLFSSVLFGVYMGIIAWAGLWLRDPSLRRIFPFSAASSPNS
jgi:hypothetical protein